MSLLTAVVIAALTAACVGITYLALYRGDEPRQP